jgi:hypothetical protein
MKFLTGTQPNRNANDSRGRKQNQQKRNARSSYPDFIHILTISIDKFSHRKEDGGVILDYRCVLCCLFVLFVVAGARLSSASTVVVPATEEQESSSQKNNIPTDEEEQ